MTGTELQQLLNEYTLSYKEFARIVEMSEGTIRRVCRNDCNVPEKITKYIEDKL